MEADKEKILDFYAWYMTSLPEPKAHADVFQLLSELALLSSEHLLSEGGQQELELTLSLLQEELLTGELRPRDLSSRLQKLLDTVSAPSPHAKLALLITQLEYCHCIRSKDDLLKNYLEHLLHSVIPTLPSLKAQAISQIVSKAKPPLLPSLKQEIGKWLTD